MNRAPVGRQYPPTTCTVEADAATRDGAPVQQHRFGLCTMAFASRAAVGALCAGDPRRLARLAVRFARPVPPGKTLTTRFYAAGANGVERHEFDTRNPAGALVLSAGLCEVHA